MVMIGMHRRIIVRTCVYVHSDSCFDVWMCLCICWLYVVSMLCLHAYVIIPLCTPCNSSTFIYSDGGMRWITALRHHPVMASSCEEDRAARHGMAMDGPDSSSGSFWDGLKSSHGNQEEADT